MSDFTGLTRTIADMIVYVWLFSIVISLLIGKQFNQFGFAIRTLPGLWLPPTSDAINRTSSIIANAETFLLLSGLLLLRGTRDLLLVTVFAILIDCLTGFLFPKIALSFNCNRILFCYLGFLLLRGYFEPGILAILITILVGCVCTPMLWGMVPIRGDSSWKVNLISFGSGALLARFLDAIVPLLPTSQLW